MKNTPNTKDFKDATIKNREMASFNAKTVILLDDKDGHKDSWQTFKYAFVKIMAQI